MTSFEYSNLSGRPPGPVVSALARVLPGVREVMAQVEPHATFWEDSNRRALSSGRPLWVVLGDSMSQGIGADAPDRGWVGRLAGEMPGVAVVNLSFNGARVTDVTARQLPALERLRAAGYEVALVTLMIGNNDLLNRAARRALPTTLRDLLDRVPVGTVVATQPGRRPSVDRFNAVVEEAARRRGLVLAEFRVPAMRDWRGRLAADRFHPNDLGYAGMADVVRRALPA